MVNVGSLIEELKQIKAWAWQEGGDGFFEAQRCGLGLCRPLNESPDIEARRTIARERGEKWAERSRLLQHLAVTIDVLERYAEGRLVFGWHPNKGEQ